MNNFQRIIRWLERKVSEIELHELPPPAPTGKLKPLKRPTAKRKPRKKITPMPM